MSELVIDMKEASDLNPSESDRQVEAHPLRRHLDPEFADTYALARRWRDESLRSGASLIRPSEIVWTPEVAAELEQHVVLTPDASNDTFARKLAGQLDGAGQTAHLLLADLLVVHLLAPNNIGLEKKLALVNAVGEMAPEPFEVPNAMHPALRRGPVNAGIGFLTQRFWIVAFMIRFAGRWSALGADERDRVLDDAWAMKEFVADVPGERDQSQRNALLFLLFPETFEDITSDRHKRAIVEAHADVAGDDPDVDRRLLAARKGLGKRFGDGFGWYHSSVLPTWDRSKPVDRSTTPDKTSGHARAWIVRMKRDGEREVVDALSRGDCRIFWAIDVSPGSSLNEIKRAFNEADPDQSPGRLANHAGQVHRFITKMRVGDYVLAPDGAELYIGEIASDARRESGEWIRDVTWINGSEPVDRGDVSSGLYSRLRTLLTVTEISEFAGELALLAEAVDTTEEVPLNVASGAPRASLRRIDTDTARRLHLDRDWLQDIVELLERKGQLIFFGPPGTGKTFLAEKLAEHLVGDEPSNYRIVQFHPSYAYEDFVEGFRPVVEPGGAMVYELRPGPLRQLADEARDNPADPYLLIIDEINRGNLAKIFGELYYLLEYRERSVVLQYGSGAEDEFSLPENLFLIGTMNTADRSIALVDAAIRRRFGFVEFSPFEAPVGDMLSNWLRHEKRDDRPARLLDELNRRLDDRDLAIGPSYLMKAESGDDAGLERIWRHEIMPLLHEQFYGRREAAGRFTLEALLAAIAPEVDGSKGPLNAGPEASGDAVGDD